MLVRLTFCRGNRYILLNVSLRLLVELSDRRWIALYSRHALHHRRMPSLGSKQPSGLTRSMLRAREGTGVCHKTLPIGAAPWQSKTLHKKGKSIGQMRRDR